VADQWNPDYLDKVTGSDKHGIHLLGWTGDYNDTDNFLGSSSARRPTSGASRTRSCSRR
jgi:ABC-type oligopeptide transport system substrate-binding subunit